MIIYTEQDWVTFLELQVMLGKIWTFIQSNPHLAMHAQRVDTPEIHGITKYQTQGGILIYPNPTYLLTPWGTYEGLKGLKPLKESDTIALIHSLGAEKHGNKFYRIGKMRTEVELRPPHQFLGLEHCREVWDGLRFDYLKMTHKVGMLYEYGLQGEICEVVDFEPDTLRIHLRCEHKPEGDLAYIREVTRLFK